MPPPSNPGPAQLYEALFTHGADGVFLTRPDGAIVRANPAACRALGATEEDLVALGRAGVVVDEPGLRELLAQRRERGVTRGVIHLRRMDGSVFPAEITSAIVAGLGGEDHAVTIFRDVSERERAEQALADSEARYRSVVTAMGEGVVLQDPGGAIQMCNAAAEHILGLSFDQMSGRTSVDPRWRSIHEDGSPFPGDTHPAMVALATGEPVRDVVMGVHKPGGALTWISVNAEPIRAADGGLRAVVTTFIDITERLQAEHRVEEHEREQEAILRTALDGFWLLDMETRFLEVNEAACAMLGYGREELLRMRVADVETAESLEENLAHAERIRRQGRDRFEARHRRKDGTVISVEVSVQYLALGGGKLVAFVRDVTERKRDADALAASEKLFRSAFENASIGNALADTAGRFLRVNRTLCDMLGYPADRLLGMTWRELTHPDEAATSPLLDQAGAEAAAVETRLLRQDGRVVWAKASSSLVRDAGGAPLYRVTGVMDVTAHREAEEALRHSQKMDAVGQLAGGIAHDFNNLLTVMLSASSFALDEAPAQGRLREEIEEFRTAAERARELTRQLLAFGRRQVLAPRVLDLNGLIRDMERLLGRLLGGQVVLRPSLAPDLGLVLADPGQLQQVILNLAINARDAMPAGGTLVIETSNVELPAEGEPPPGGATHRPGVRLAVEDQGTGMDDQVKARLFEPFFTTKPVGQGTGLGLSTVFGIVKQSGGSIRVDSEPGCGTRFELCFPRVAAQPPGPPAVTPGAVAAPAGAGQTVLVVEDDALVRRVAVRTLEGAGFDVLSAATLEEAVERVREHRRVPAVLLADVRMPSHSGPEVAAALAARLPGLRTVYMSGYPSEELWGERALPAETLFVQKPFTSQSLVEKVLEALAAPASPTPP